MCQFLMTQAKFQMMQMKWSLPRGHLIAELQDQSKVSPNSWVWQILLGWLTLALSSAVCSCLDKEFSFLWILITVFMIHGRQYYQMQFFSISVFKKYYYEKFCIFSTLNTTVHIWSHWRFGRAEGECLSKHHNCLEDKSPVVVTESDSNSHQKWREFDGHCET